MRFRIDKVIASRCEKVVRKAAADLAAGAPRAKHSTHGGGPAGGKLLQALRRPKALVTRKRWGAVIEWSKLKQEFLWLIRGTKHQPARPVTLAPSEEELRGDVERAAEKYFAARDRRRGGR